MPVGNSLNVTSIVANFCAVALLVGSAATAWIEAATLSLSAGLRRSVLQPSADLIWIGACSGWLAGRCDGCDSQGSADFGYVFRDNVC